MSKSRKALNPAALTVGTSVEEHADPSTGGDAVFVVGIAGGITIGTVNQGAPNAGGAQAWPVQITNDLSAANPTSLPDQTATGVAVVLGNLAAGPGGLLIACVPSPISASNSITRVSGTGVGATQGIPLAPGGSIVLTSWANANQLSIIAEVAGGVISVSQV